MPTHFLDYKNRIKDLRFAEKCAKEEKLKAIQKGDKDAEQFWEKAEEKTRLEAKGLENAIKNK